MGNYRIDPKKQFSKRLARWTAVFWFVYMSWLSVILILEPSAALYSVYMGIIGTAVMLVSVVSYTHNSVQEKFLFALLDKTKLELSLKCGKNPVASGGTETYDETEEEGSEDADG